MLLNDFTKKIWAKRSLSANEAHAAFDLIFAGQTSPDAIGAFLTALHNKGETADEIRGAAESMRAKAVTIAAPPDAIDIVGTGGDGRNTLNISTAAALVVAACGVPVAKHGNRAATSRSGSSDVLAALGINLEPPFAILEKCLHDANLCFLFAPRHHPAMRQVADVRRKLGTRTIFNLLGPLTNPANVKRHLIGVYAAKWMEPMAETLRQLGSTTAWLTHGRDGLDELTTAAASDVVALDRGLIGAFVLKPQDAGITPLTTPNALTGGDAAHNAGALRRLLDGDKSPYRDIVVLNAGAALVVAGKAPNLSQGVGLAATAVDSGAARDILKRIIDITNQV
ncbi:MAG: anthranilate phosphoribosyltransferase [Alphaproteobacteria bacterium]|nr:anthranilate phosphoribosyltransferase [Alphaproteobacteria bacterium]